jgi:hypothetical protein
MTGPSDCFCQLSDVFALLTVGALSRIRTYAHGSGGGSSVPPLPAQTSMQETNRSAGGPQMSKRPLPRLADRSQAQIRIARVGGCLRLRKGADGCHRCRLAIPTAARNWRARLWPTAGALVAAITWRLVVCHALQTIWQVSKTLLSPPSMCGLVIGREYQDELGLRWSEANGPDPPRRRRDGRTAHSAQVICGAGDRSGCADCRGECRVRPTAQLGRDDTDTDTDFQHLLYGGRRFCAPTIHASVNASFSARGPRGSSIGVSNAGARGP